MRKHKGTIFILIGLLLICGAGGLTFYNRGQEKQAKENSNKVLSSLTVEEVDEEVIPDYLINPEMEMPIQEIDGVEYCGVLSIPTMGMQWPVVNELDLNRLKIAPCRYVGKAYDSDFVIAAHNYNTHFGAIKSLQEGDRVTFRDLSGNLFTYEVAVQEELQPTMIEEMTLSGYDMTLFTCTVGGQARVTVRCKLISTDQFPQ